MKPKPAKTVHDDDSVTDQDRIDEAMAESFPASDPPSWTAGVSHEPVHPPKPTKEVDMHAETEKLERHALRPPHGLIP